MKSFMLIVIVTSISLSLFSQENKTYYLTGNLSSDAKQLLTNFNEPTNPQLLLSPQNKKSPVLAGVLSLLIPGAGEIYSEEYLKAGIFLAIEAAVITTAVIYDGKGDDKTTEFQNYADDYTNNDPVTGHNWNVVRYAQWLIDHEGADPNIRLDNRDINDTQQPPWDRVDWALLNASEKGSHKLPRYGEQQYYELIGKYHQYSSGWNDFSGAGNKDQISPNFTFYSGMRGEANDFYSTASTAVIGIYVNHFLSALDAVWSAAQFNNDLAVKIRLENLQLTSRAEFIPTLYLSYNF